MVIPDGAAVIGLSAGTLAALVASGVGVVHGSPDLFTMPVGPAVQQYIFDGILVAAVHEDTPGVSVVVGGGVATLSDDSQTQNLPPLILLHCAFVSLHPVLSLQALLHAEEIQTPPVAVLKLQPFRHLELSQ